MTVYYAPHSVDTDNEKCLGQTCRRSGKRKKEPCLLVQSVIPPSSPAPVIQDGEPITNDEPTCFVAIESAAHQQHSAMIETAANQRHPEVMGPQLISRAHQ